MHVCILLSLIIKCKSECWDVDGVICSEHPQWYMNLQIQSMKGCIWELPLCTNDIYLLDASQGGPEYGADYSYKYNVWVANTQTDHFMGGIRYTIQGPTDWENCVVFKAFFSDNIGSEIRHTYDCIALLPSQRNHIKLSAGYIIKNYLNSVELFYNEYLDSSATFEVKECDKGQWLTCVDSLDCQYLVPLSAGNWSNQGQVFYMRNYIPVGNCYPCVSGISKDHYEVSGNAYCGFRPNPENIKCRSKLVEIDQLNRLYCPGGAHPPIFCPPGSVANSARTDCICEPGKYLDPTNNQCVICPKAHKCIESTSIRCEDHTYQSETGQSTCLNCLTNNKLPRATCGIKQKAVQCTYKNDEIDLTYLTNPECVPCLQCSNKIIDNFRSQDQNYLDCYDI